MSSSTLFRLGGLAAILSGLCVIAGWALPDGLIGGTINLLSLVLAPLALTGIYLLQQKESGGLGVVGYVINVLGMILVAGVVHANTYVMSFLSDSQQEELLAGTAGIAFMVSGITMLVGAILFGIATFRAGVFPRAAAVLYVLGAVPLTLVPLFPRIVVVAGAVVLGVGVIWLGYALWSSQGERAMQAQARRAV